MHSMAQIHLFVSSYTPHTAHRNAYERLLSVPLPLGASDRPLAGDDDVLARRRRFAPYFCYPWTGRQSDKKDILLRMDESDLKTELLEKCN
jgi:hypothetical protein